ncbi:MAG: hypothetical protein M3R37_14395 [Actinomycetota bacterium]|nr:hypothetical protein [Actinomycetota bacterium]
MTKTIRRSFFVGIRSYGIESSMKFGDDQAVAGSERRRRWQRDGPFPERRHEPDPLDQVGPRKLLELTVLEEVPRASFLAGDSAVRAAWARVRAVVASDESSGLMEPAKRFGKSSANTS